MKKTLMALFGLTMMFAATGCDNRTDFERNVDEAAGDVKRAAQDAAD